MYFNPLFTFPFSTMDTIREEKNEIVAIAAMEKYLKLSGLTDTAEMLNGMTVVVVPASLPTKFRIITKR